MSDKTATIPSPTVVNICVTTELLGNTLEHLDAPVLVFSLDFRIIYANKAFYALGPYTPEQMKDFTLFNSPTLTEEERQRYVNIHREILSGKIESFEIENTAINVSGEEIRMLWKTRLIRASGSQPDYFISSGHEITALWKTQEELRKAKEQAEKATLLKDRFIALLSHDMRSPLGNLIYLLDDIVLLGSDEKEKLKRSAGSALEITHWLAGLIDSLLNVNRFGYGDIKLSKCRFKIANLCETALKNIVVAAERKNITVNINIPTDAELFADSMLFAQVVNNLVYNAIKFTEESGSISLFLPESFQQTIAVKDSGIGIAPEIAEKLFTDDRVTSIGTDGERGIGLGLSFCRDIAAAHGGTVWFETENGIGTTFYAKFGI